MKKLVLTLSIVLIVLLVLPAKEALARGRQPSRVLSVYDQCGSGYGHSFYSGSRTYSERGIGVNIGFSTVGVQPGYGAYYPCQSRVLSVYDQCGNGYQSYCGPQAQRSTSFSINVGFGTSNIRVR